MHFTDKLQKFDAYIKNGKLIHQHREVNFRCSHSESQGNNGSLQGKKA